MAKLTRAQALELLKILIQAKKDGLLLLAGEEIMVRLTQLYDIKLDKESSKPQIPNKEDNNLSGELPQEEE